MRPNSILMIAMWLMLVTVGCGGCGRYDRRLVQADSLMWTHADSALAIVVALGDSTLSDGRNRAYRDLLLTQARYKAYQPITARDDSTITRAMDWYRRHDGEREKLTRATLYKGAVMEELGHVDSAMIYYKTAEAAAYSTDYANLGQINTRIADLYRIHYGDEQICFEKYLQSYRYYQLAGNKKQQFNCLYCMFMMEGIIYHEQFEEIYTKALALAGELKDEKRMSRLYELRCRQLLLADSTRDQAKRIALMCLDQYSQYTSNDLLLDLAYLYIQEGKADSARHFIGHVEESSSPGQQQRIAVRKHEILSMIDAREGKTGSSAAHLAKSNNLSDTILNSSDKYGLQQIESALNQIQSQKSRTRARMLMWLLAAVVALTIITIVTMTATHVRRQRRIRAIIQNMQKAQIHDHDDLVRQLDDKNGAVERLFANLMGLFKYYTGNEVQSSSTAQVEQRIKETIVNVANDDFWVTLRSFLDKKYGGIISAIAHDHGLKEKDLRFIELECCGFSNAEIAIMMGYSLKYISNKRYSLARKMGLETSLQDFLLRQMAENVTFQDNQKQ